jgi:hypothetical protein
MKKIIAFSLNRFIFILTMVLLATIMMTFVGVTETNAQSSSGGFYEAWVARYDGPAGDNDEVTGMAVDGLGNVYVTGRSYGSGTSADYATIKYDTNGNQLWVARYDGPASDYDDARAIALDASGNVYVTGMSVRADTFGDYATIKYDPDGNQLWVAFYNGPGSFMDIAKSIALDSSGNAYVTGSSFGSGTDTDYATIKYDPDGNELWVKRYHGSGNSEDSARAIVLDDSGNVYVTGVSIGDGTYYDYATIKYDPDGNELWVARYDGPASDHDDACAIALDSSGNVYVTGRSDDIRSYSDRDYATIKYDTNGNQLWLQRYNGPGNEVDEANAIAADGAGNVYVTGQSDFGDIPDDEADYATIKYDTDGNQLWLSRYNGNFANALALDVSGNVYVTGGSWSGDTGYDYATIKYDTNGNEVWVGRYNGPENTHDVAIALALDGSGNVYVTGSTLDGGNFDYATVKYSPSAANQPPEAICQDVTVPTEPGICGADASVDDGSFDPDGDPITVEQTPPGPYALGDTEVTLTVTDDKGASDTCDATVTVVDQEAPVISSLSATPNVLWPSNHKMVLVTVAVNASDNCGSSCEIISVDSNEPVGKNVSDWLIMRDLTVKLRAERIGKGHGREYTIMVECSDASGNSSTATTKVTVPHDKGK